MTTICLSSNGWNDYANLPPATRLLAAGAGAVSILEREAENAPWVLKGRVLEGLHVAALAIDPVTGGVFAGTHHDDGIWFSGDDGETWEERSEGLRVRHIYSLRCVSGPSGTVVFAGTDPASLFRSDDLGRTWTEYPALITAPGHEAWRFPAPPHVGHTKTMAIDPRNIDVIYAGIEQGGLYKTIDGGRTWRELDSYFRSDDPLYKDIHQVILSRHNPDEVFFTMGAGFLHSRDAGETWARLTDASFYIGYPDQFIVSPLDERTIFIAGARHPPGKWREEHTAHSAIARSRDSGRTWENLAGRGIPEDHRPNFEAIGVSARTGGYTLWLGDTDGDLYQSEDDGESFTIVARGLGPFSKSFHFAPLQTKPTEAHDLILQKLNRNRGA